MAWSRENFWALLKAQPRPALPLLSRTNEERDGYAVETLVFDAGDGATMRGGLTRPLAAREPGPALLYMHAHGGRYDVGARELLDGQTYMGPRLARCSLARGSLR